jgi:dihydroorotate dehydrogenase
MSALYTSALRPLMFCMPPEAAHDLAKITLRSRFPWSLAKMRKVTGLERLRCKAGGLELASPLGLAAGFDKNAEALPGLDQLGFGYLTVGSILPSPRAGNRKPRLLRLPEKESLLNCYGLPSAGLDDCAVRLERFSRQPRRSRVIANIDSPDVDSYMRSFRRIEPHVDAIEIGTQCPNNTDGHGEFHAATSFEQLLKAILAVRRKPVFVKILPYANETERQGRLELAGLATHYGVDGITMPGSWREQEPRLSLGYGQTSGHMIFPRTLATIRELYGVTRGRIAIKANGGVFTGEEAFQALAAGADTVEVLTSLVYRGWNVAAQINAELIAALDSRGLRDVRELRAQLPA